MPDKLMELLYIFFLHRYHLSILQKVNSVWNQIEILERKIFPLDNLDKNIMWIFFIF